MNRDLNFWLTGFDFIDFRPKFSRVHFFRFGLI